VFDHDPQERMGRAALSDVGARLVRGVSWNLIGTAFNQGSTFLVNIILANLWGLRTFGEYAIVLSTVAAVIYVAQLATGATATRYVAQYRLSNRARAARLIGLCAIVAGVAGALATMALLVAAPWLASALVGVQLAPTLRIAALSVVPGVMNGFMTGALAGLESYPALGRAGMVSGVVYFGTCTVGGWIAGINGAFAGVVVSAVVQCLVLHRALVSEAVRQQIELRLSGATQETDMLLTFTVPSALYGFLYLPATWLTNVFLVGRPGGYEQVALFAAANNLRTITLFVPAMTNAVGVSLLNNQRGAENEHLYRRVFWTNLTTAGAFVFAGASVMAAAGGRLLAVFGPGFPAGYPVLVVLLTAAILETLVVATLQPLQSQDRMWAVLCAAILPCYVTIVGMASALAPTYGALGIAWAYVSGWSVGLVASLSMVVRLGIWKRRVTPDPVNA
jgi:O-antigen/teichoic acid export membrane protein